MKVIKIYQEELDTNLEEIQKVEKIWGTPFPSEYKDFLLKHNGGVPYPTNVKNFWPIERFLSLGDIEIQKLYPTMTYTLHDIEEEDLEPHQLSSDEILVFALGERGIYFLNLNPNDYGQLYFANFSGGNGIEKMNTNSFSDFLNSLDIPEWSDEKYDPNFQFTKLHYSGNKIFQSHLFYTPNNPELGFKRFKEVFEMLGDIQPPETGYPNIPQKYVHDKSRLEYLLEKGCKTDGLLRYARKAATIKYLVEEKGLDINKRYKGRYPLQTYLTTTSTYDIKVKYELIAELLELGVEMDWSIKGTQVDGNPDLPMIEKLRVLHEKYLRYEIDDKNRWIKSGYPDKHTPFKKSKLIEKKLGLSNNDNWFSRIFKR